MIVHCHTCQVALPRYRLFLKKGFLTMQIFGLSRIYNILLFFHLRTVRDAYVIFQSITMGRDTLIPILDSIRILSFSGYVSHCLRDGILCPSNHNTMSLLTQKALRIGKRPPPGCHRTSLLHSRSQIEACGFHGLEHLSMLFGSCVCVYWRVNSSVEKLFP